MFWKTNPVQADSFPFSPEYERFFFFLTMQEFLSGYSLSGCFINPAWDLVNVLALSTQVFFSTEEFIIIASPLPGSCIFLEILLPMCKVVPLPGLCWCFWCSWLHRSDLCLSSRGCVSVSKLPFPCNDPHHCIRAHTNQASPFCKDPIIVSGLTLTWHDLNLAWLLLQRPYFQTRSHSGVLGGHAVWGDTIQHSTVRNNTWVSLVAQWQSMCLPMQEMQVQSLSGEDPLEKEMATHSSILAWEIPWTEMHGGLQAMRLQKSRSWLND